MINVSVNFYQAILLSSGISFHLHTNVAYQMFPLPRPVSSISSWLNLVYNLLTICLRFVYSFFTTCLHFVNTLFTTCLQFVYYLFTTCLLFVYNLFTICLQLVYNLFTFCLQLLKRVQEYEMFVVLAEFLYIFYSMIDNPSKKEYQRC